METKEALRQFYETFEFVKREDDSGYYRLKKEHAQWVQDVCREAHLGHMPNDRYYETIYVMAGALFYTHQRDQSLDDVYDVVSDNLEADAYTSDLTGWLHEFNNHLYYIDEAIQELGDFKDGFQLLAYSQIIWKREVLDKIISGLKDVIDA